jgi:hypothetical protein
MLLLALTGLAVSLVSVMYYPAPWAATNAYPIVYIGASTACVAAGRALARTLGALGGIHPAGATRIPWVGAAAGVALAMVLAATTNLDLAGNTDFIFTWWGSFAARYQF